MAITLNCDLGEGLDDLDALLMPHIDMASIACGGHAGDASSMSRTVDIAVIHNVDIGAHPSYPDRANFGRVSLAMAAAELSDSLHRQIQALQQCAQAAGSRVRYIKPHGALYNDAGENRAILDVLLQLGADFSLPLVVPAPLRHSAAAGALIYEAFADRAYTDSGTLVARRHPHAVHYSIDRIAEQVEHLVDRQGVYSESGNWVDIQADTLCVHSDSPRALEAVGAVRRRLGQRR